MTTEEQLAQNLAALSVQDSEELDELMACARYGELKEIQDQVKASGLEKIQRLLLHKGEYGRTPLHMAAANNHAGKECVCVWGVVSYFHSGCSTYTVSIRLFLPPSDLKAKTGAGCEEKGVKAKRLMKNVMSILPPSRYRRLPDHHQPTRGNQHSER
jgi:hypothetical protein